MAVGLFDYNMALSERATQTVRTSHSDLCLGECVTYFIAFLLITSGAYIQISLYRVTPLVWLLVITLTG